jgi:hypothetical protein
VVPARGARVLDSPPVGPPLLDHAHSLSVARGSTAADEAEIIDLVHLPRGTRPTPIASIEYEEVGRCRVLDCEHYARCLAFAASVHWKSFHCRQCPEHPDRRARAVSPPTPPGGSARGPVVIKLR